MAATRRRAVGNVTITPSISLIRVVPEEVIKKYAQGHFSDIKLSPFTEKVTGITQCFEKSISRDVNDHIFISKEGRTGAEMITVTTNCKNYEFIRSGNVAPMGGKCEWCRKDFEHESVGVPLFINTIFDQNGKLVMGIHTEGIFHDWRCVRAHMDIFSPRYREIYPDSYSTLETVFNMMYPTKKLRPAPHYRLLIWNGGSLTEAEWNDESFIYKPTPNLILLSLKETFMKIKRSQ